MKRTRTSHAPRARWASLWAAAMLLCLPAFTRG